MFLRCIVPRNSWPCLKASSCCCLGVLGVDLLFYFKVHCKHRQCQVPEQRGWGTQCHRSLTPAAPCSHQQPATTLSRVSSSRKVLVHSQQWKENWPQTQHTSHTTHSRLAKNLLKRSTCYSPSPIFAGSTINRLRKPEEKNVLQSLEMNNSENYALLHSYERHEFR